VNESERITQRIEELAAPAAGGLGLSIVQVVYRREASGWVLRLLVERPEGDAPVSVDDCSQLSRELSTLLDVEDLVPGAYRLEVSSPGLDRPLTRLQDFARFAGHEITLKTHEPVSGRRNFRGLLRGVDEDRVLLTVDGQAFVIPFGGVAKANLVPDLGGFPAGKARGPEA
jgi:ribosome maturation factor RimP